MSRVRVKICCIQNVAEAQLAIRYGASALGLVSAMPSGFGPIGENRIAEIVETIPPGVASFLLTCAQDAKQIIAQQRQTRVNTIQICDRIEHETYQELRQALPGVSLVQVIHVAGPESVDEAIGIAPFVNGILLDSGNQSLAIKELGGTGRVHDWSLSDQIVRSIDRPVYLAGGLKPENVADAVKRVRPFGVDVCTGLRTDGRLDETKVAAFFTALGN
jgi:phosphoribosylanthranilate isomerase